MSGFIGAASAGLSWLQGNAKSPDDLPADPALAECVARHRRPEPRARLGQVVGRSRAASACMDLSDGLADAIGQIAEASGTGARIDAAALPIHRAAAEWFAARGEDPVQRCVAGGDDYELLFAVPPRRKGRLRNAVRLARGLSVTKIGELTTNRAVEIETAGRTSQLPPGFVHF